MTFPILTFSSEDICIVYDNMDRIEIKGEKVLDDSDYFGSECDGHISCLINIAKKMKDLDLCSRVRFKKASYNSNECVISSHYPRIRIDGETIYDGEVGEPSLKQRTNYLS